MGLINSLKRITSARLDAFLDSVEDPEILLPRLVKELQGKVGVTLNGILGLLQLPLFLSEHLQPGL